MHARRALVAALALTLALAACGGGDDDADETTTTAAAEETTASSEPDDATTTEAPTTTEAIDDPQAIAEAVNLTERDFPAGWVAEPPEDDGSDITDCFVDSDLAGNTVAEADSDTFSLETETTVLAVASTGIVTSGVGVASTVLGEATRAAFADCVLGQFEDSLAEDGLTVTDANLDYASGAPTDAEQVIALNGAVAIEDPEGNPYEAELSMWLHRQGAVIVGVSVLDLGDTDFAGWVDTANDIVSERLVEVVG